MFFLAPLFVSGLELAGGALYGALAGATVGGAVAAVYPAYTAGQKSEREAKVKAQTDLQKAEKELTDTQIKWAALQEESRRVMENARLVIHQHAQQVADQQAMATHVYAPSVPVQSTQVPQQPPTGGSHPQ